MFGEPYRAAEQRRSWHFDYHGGDGQVEDLRVALAGTLHARGHRWPGARQVPAARQGIGAIEFLTLVSTH